MSGIETFATLPMWTGFVGFVLVILALDLFVFGGKRAHRVSPRETLAWAVAWVMLATLFLSRRTIACEAGNLARIADPKDTELTRRA